MDAIEGVMVARHRVSVRLGARYWLLSSSTLRRMDAIAANTITVVGEGSATVMADSAELTVGLEVRAATPGDAMAEVSRRCQAVLAGARAQGVADGDVQTRGVQVYPTFDQHGGRVVDYVASYSLGLRLRALASAADVLDAVTGAAEDALRLGGFRLATSATDSARADAGARAVQAARGRAERLAEAAGVRVARVVSIAEEGVIRPGPGPVRAAAAPVGFSAAVPVEGGSEEVTARVRVIFAIAD